LEELSASDCDYDPKRLLSMVEARYGSRKDDGSDVEEGDGSDVEEGDGSDVADNDQLDFPPPLKWVAISHNPGEADWRTLDLVKDILGPGCSDFDEHADR
ncbi:hypothetical protein FRC00_006139, partial [Tulasnella sp. 408]